jgi:hypothetical protein
MIYTHDLNKADGPCEALWMLIPRTTPRTPGGNGFSAAIAARPV